MRSGCILLLAAFMTGITLILPVQRNTSRSDIENVLGVVLPPEATNIDFEHQAAFMISVRWLRFDAPDDEALRDFLEALALDTVIEEGVNPFAEQDVDAPSWWDADEQQHVRGGIYQQRGDAEPK